MEAENTSHVPSLALKELFDSPELRLHKWALSEDSRAVYWNALKYGDRFRLTVAAAIHGQSDTQGQPITGFACWQNLTDTQRTAIVETLDAAVAGSHYEQ